MFTNTIRHFVEMLSINSRNLGKFTITVFKDHNSVYFTINVDLGVNKNTSYKAKIKNHVKFR